MIVGVLLTAVAGASPWSEPGDTTAVTFSVYGDSPYRPLIEEDAIRRYAAEDSADPNLDFMVHVGDIADGFHNQDLPDEYLRKFVGLFGNSAKPLFFLLGDNESTDLASPKRGLERWAEIVAPSNLNALKMVTSHGTKEDLPGTFLFEVRGVVFVGLTIPGVGYNYFSDDLRQQLRDRNVAWLRKAIDVAGSRPLVIFCHEYPLALNGLGRTMKELEGFRRDFRTATASRSAPTLLIRGSFHKFYQKCHPHAKYLEVSIERTSWDRGPQRFSVSSDGTFEVLGRDQLDCRGGAALSK